MNSKNTDKKGSVCQKLREVEMDQFSENEIDNYGKATVCQKAPDKTQMDAMIQRSKDYGLKVAAPNMETDNYDSDTYDTEAIAIDKRNGNFSEDRLEDYRHENIVQTSLVNGQFSQARKQCESYGLNYELEKYKFDNQ